MYTVVGERTNIVRVTTENSTSYNVIIVISYISIIIKVKFLIIDNDWDATLELHPKYGTPLIIPFMSKIIIMNNRENYI